MLPFNFKRAFLPAFPDLTATNSIKKQVDDVSSQQTIISDLFYTIAEQIASQQNWMLGDKFTEILDLIDDEEQKRIVTIDNIFSVIQKLCALLIAFNSSCIFALGIGHQQYGECPPTKGIFPQLRFMHLLLENV